MVDDIQSSRIARGDRVGLPVEGGAAPSVGAVEYPSSPASFLRAISNVCVSAIHVTSNPRSFSGVILTVTGVVARRTWRYVEPSLSMPSAYFRCEGIVLLGRHLDGVDAGRLRMSTATSLPSSLLSRLSADAWVAGDVTQLRLVGSAADDEFGAGPQEPDQGGLWGAVGAHGREPDQRLPAFEARGDMLPAQIGRGVEGGHRSPWSARRRAARGEAIRSPGTDPSPWPGRRRSSRVGRRVDDAELEPHRLGAPLTACSRIGPASRNARRRRRS